ncbi:MAG: glycosyltransferase family 4 protein [Rhodospirillaceae bacterium]|jgi:glycosyltransferase involved in cell wall biosynthesis|nr:glycosyltransferase family 4 protein [Rhodospirillaceae bacterium]MBT6119192.1 glycosyltransferase family 4 protein [Rhodospirillaceae bacterium]
MTPETGTADAAQSNTVTGADERGRHPGGATVLQVVPALEQGGLERGTVEVAAAVIAAGGTALVASSGGRMVHDLARVGARHVELPVHRKSPIAIRRNADRLADLIREAGVDIVHARSRAPAWAAWMAAERTGRPFVTTVHGPYSAGGLKKRYNEVMTRGARVIAISEFIAGYLQSTYGVGRPPVRVIHRGVDTEVFDPEKVSPARLVQLAEAWRLPDDEPVVLLPGRLTRWKGQTVLIEAIARLGRRDLRCVLLGSDQGRTAYRRELERLAEKRGLDGIVQFVDDCRDMAAAYMLADVVVSASTDPEGFGRVVVEAQAMGRPVIGTDHGAAKETIEPGQTGWLVAPGDPGALADALGDALAMTPAARSFMAWKQTDMVRAHFTVRRMCDETLALYDEVLALPSASAA